MHQCGDAVSRVLPLGEVLRAAREMRGLTLTELGKRAGLAPVTVWRLEGERRRPQTRTLARLCAALDYEPRMLLRYARQWRQVKDEAVRWRWQYEANRFRAAICSL